MEVKVKVTSKAKRDELREVKPHVFEAFVKDRAEQNMANEKVISLLAEHYAVTHKAVRLIRGHHQPSKTFLVVIR